MHPRNRHQSRYDFAELLRVDSELARFVRPNPLGDQSIDFADPDAVLALNRALLCSFYGISHWEIPRGYLCPPIPGRADYIHYVADLLALSNEGSVPRGKRIAVVDIGVGANCIYPIIGIGEYGWQFVGSEVDAAALDAAGGIVVANPSLRERVDLRLQSSPTKMFEGVIKPGERFDVSICNPPFHASAAEAAAGTRRKLRNLGRALRSDAAPVLNFGGLRHELWCNGGEAGFVRRLIRDSARFSDTCLWFSSLVSKRETLPLIQHALHAVKAVKIQTFDMAQGQKKSRIVAWTFLGAEAHRAWATQRWR